MGYPLFRSRLVLNLFTPLAVAALLCTLPAFAQNATIQGHINSVPLNHPTMNAKVVIKKTTGQRVDSTYTDFAGDYFKAFTVTNVASVSGLPEEFKLKQNYPNPFNPSTKTELEVPKPGTVSVEVFDILGKKVASNTYEAQPGVLGIDVSGLGTAGVYFLRASFSNGISKTIKMVNLGSDGKPSIDVNQLSSTGPTSTATPRGKANLNADSIDVEVSKPGYVTHTRRLPFNPSTVYNSDLQKVPAPTSFKIKPFKVDGIEIDSITLRFVTSDSVRYFSKGSDGFVQINWNDYKENPDATAKVTHLNANFAPWIIGRKPRQRWNETNLYQNGVNLPWPNPGRLDTAIIPLSVMNSPTHRDSSYMYLMPEWHTRADGLRISFNDSMWVFIDYRFQPGTEKYMADNVDFLVFSYNRTTNIPLTQAQLNQMYDKVYNQLSKFVLANGDTLQKFTVHQVNSLSDSIYLACQARDWDNVVRTWREQTSVPGNSLEIHPSGRIKNSASSYPNSTTNNIIAAEIHGTLTTSDDGLGGVGSAAYIVELGNTGHLNELGSNLIRFLYLASLDTRGFGVQR